MKPPGADPERRGAVSSAVPRKPTSNPIFRCDGLCGSVNYAFEGTVNVTVTIGLTFDDGGDVCANAPNQTATGQIQCGGIGVLPCFGPTPDLCQPDAGGLGTDASYCTYLESTFSDYCTNLQSDVDNCGACGNACPSGDVCSDGGCAAPSPEP